jgi:hypothetical protein
MEERKKGRNKYSWKTRNREGKKGRKKYRWKTRNREGKKGKNERKKCIG